MAERIEIVIDGKGAAAGAQVIKRALGDVQGATVKTDSALGTLQKTIKGFAVFTVGALGFAGLVAGMRSAIDTASQFQSALSNLSAITGATGRDLDFLSNKALEISKNSRSAARDVVEAFKLVGSAQPELLKSGEALSEVTRQAILLAEAATIQVPNAARALTTALNQFGAGADQAARFVNVLAAGSQLGSAEVDALAVAVTKAGTSASLAGISFEELIGTVGTLAASGAPIETIGTSLRNIFIRLQSGADKTNPAVVGLTQALKNLGDENLSVAEKTKLFGLENVNVAENLIKSADAAERLTRAITGTDTALKQAEINSDNLAGDLDKLGNAWDNFAIKVIDKAGPIRFAIQTVTDALNLLTEAFSDDPLEEALKTQELLEKRLKELDRFAETPHFQTAGPIADITEELTAVTLKIAELRPGLEGASFDFDSLAKSTEAANDNLGGTPPVVDKAKEAYEKLTVALHRETSQLSLLKDAHRLNEKAVIAASDKIEAENLLVASGIKLHDEEATAITLQVQERNKLIRIIEQEKSAREKAAEAQKKEDEERKRANEEALREAERLKKQQEELLQEPLKNAIRGIQDAFTDMFRSIFDGGITNAKDFGRQLLDIMKELAAQIATLLVFKPVVGTILGGAGFGGISSQLGIPAGGSIFGSGSISNALNTPIYGGAGPGAGPGSHLAAGPTYGQVLGGGLAGAGIGYGLAGITGQNAIGGTLGGAAGGAIGTAIAPGIGTFIGAALGSVLGGAIGDLFGGGKSNQTIQVGTVATGKPQPVDRPGKQFFEGGRFRSGPFGDIGLINSNTSGTKGSFDDQIVDLILKVDESIASILDIRQEKLVAKILQESQRGIKVKASSLGEGDFGKIIRDRILTILDGLAGQRLQGARDILEKIPVKNIAEIEAEGKRLIEIVALFADGFERGLKAITGGFTPLEQQIFELEESAAAAAKGLLDRIEAVREAVDILRPDKLPTQDEFTKTVTKTVTRTVGQGDNKRVITEVIKQQIPDVEAYKKALEEAKKALKDHNMKQAEAEKALRKMALAALGLGKASDEEPLKGAALALKEIEVRFKAMKDVLIELGFTSAQADDKIKKAIAKAKIRLRDDFNKSIRQQILQIKDPLKAALKEHDEIAKQRIKDAKKLGGDLAKVEKLNRLERLEILKRFGEDAIKQIQDQINRLDQFRFSLKTGSLSALSQRDQLSVARQNFNQIAQKALKGEVDVDAFAAAAQAFLSQAQQFSGSGANFQAAFAQVMAIADQLGINLNDDLNKANKDLAEILKGENKKNRKNVEENVGKVNESIKVGQQLHREQIEHLMTNADLNREQIKILSDVLAQLQQQGENNKANHRSAGQQRVA